MCAFLLAESARKPPRVPRESHGTVCTSVHVRWGIFSNYMQLLSQSQD